MKGPDNKQINERTQNLVLAEDEIKRWMLCKRICQGKGEVLFGPVTLSSDLLV